MNDVITNLHADLTARVTPETVLVQLDKLGVLDALPAPARDQAQRLVEHRSRWAGYSSMVQSFHRHPGLARAYATAATAMAVVTDTVFDLEPIPPVDPTDPVELACFVDQCNKVLRLSPEPNPVKKTKLARVRTHTYTYPAHRSWTGEMVPETTRTWSSRDGSRGRRGDSHGHADPRTRMTAAQRREMLPGLSVRAYRHAVASVNHLEQRVGVLAAARDREAAVAFGKGRLAHTIGPKEFSANTPTAAFVAYYVARLGMRTVFTNGAQDRPMDEIAQALLDAALADPGVRADVIARVLTRQSVLSRLSEEEKGALLGVYYEQLAAFSRALRRSFDPNRDRTRMVARPGDDSTTWNAASRAFNQARTGWLNLTRALDLSWVVEAGCPGKVPALVAADVAHWHDMSGGDRHADTQVFAQLPLPWDVVLDDEACPADLVRQVCTRHGLDAEQTGWTAAYRQDGLAVTAPTPELVHGVVVASPLLAGWLRRAGAFSGRTVQTSVDA